MSTAACRNSPPAPHTLLDGLLLLQDWAPYTAEKLALLPAFLMRLPAHA